MGSMFSHTGAEFRLQSAGATLVVDGHNLMLISAGLNSITLITAFVVFAVAFLALTLYNDITGFQAAKAAGKTAIINAAFGTALVLLGTPIYFLYRRKS